jgi:hypothetical protein
VDTTKRTPILGAACLLAGGLLVASASGAAASGTGTRPAAAASSADGPSVDRRLANDEIRQLRAARPTRDRGRFTAEQNVFLPSTIALARLGSPGLANATLPLHTGVGPSGEQVHYILTEASDYVAAQRLGLNYAPKLANGVGTGGDQRVTVHRGRLHFRGAVDFSPERVLVAGPHGSPFPPATAQPGAVADDEWSSLVVLPSGLVLNAQVVANATGRHDRVISLNARARTVTLQLLDGWQDGDRYYYHLVTDSSDPVAATIELGVYAPRLARLPAFGRSGPDDDSALLGFSPTANGETGAGNPDRQGLNSTIVDDDRDPVNVFPLDPDNRQRRDNNYSPLWDAHVSSWTQEAIAAGQRRAITGFDDLAQLVDAGVLESFAGSSGRANEFVGGLRATGIIINYPVIAQPFEGQDRAPTGPRF